MSRHDPELCYAGRHGCWAWCSCGWRSRDWTTVTGAYLEFGEHLVREARLSYPPGRCGNRVRIPLDDESVEKVCELPGAHSGLHRCGEGMDAWQWPSERMAAVS